MELAGCIFGVTAAVIPAYNGIEKLCTTVSNVKHFHQRLDVFWCQVLTQKSKLRNECVYLFGNIFDDEDELDAMLQDKRHPKWEDSGFQRKFLDHLGEAFESRLAPFRVISTTLEDLGAEMEKFMPICLDSQSISNGKASVVANLPKTSMKTPYTKKGKTKMRVKIKWSVQMPRHEKLQKKLRGQINDLICLRKQRTGLEKFRALPQRSLVKTLCVGFSLSATRDLRASSKRLYDAVSAVNDSYNHCINLQLPCDTTLENGDSAISLPLKPEREFRLRIAPLSNTTSFTHLIVRARPEESFLVMTSAPPKAIPLAPVIQTLSPGGMKRKPESQSCTTAQQSRHVRFDTPRLGFKKSRPEFDNTEPATEEQQSPQEQQTLFGMNLYSEIETEAYGDLRIQWDYLKEIYSARKLSKMIASEMGLRYAKVVQRCIDCVFEVDEKDLDNAGMQEAFYENVVRELHGCVLAFG
ncbi:hypothetical protein K440DRAFT_645262 [Wilcoxina mikolae CBS 423.85]|nr:hypothetical protein K440DRAFT_645262 [Wilcoxina mikolae CBS 423.85]